MALVLKSVCYESKMQKVLCRFVGWDPEDDDAGDYKKNDDVESTWVDQHGQIRSASLRRKRKKVAYRLLLYLFVVLLLCFKRSFTARIRAVQSEDCALLWGKWSILVKNITYINPNYTPVGHQKVTTFIEGCKGGVSRFSHIKMYSMNHKEVELKGKIAACVQGALARDKCTGVK